MRRLAVLAWVAALFALLVTGGCRPREKVRLEPTQETIKLASTVHMADPSTADQLIRGFHEIEQNSWRWTMGTFSVTLKPPRGSEKSGARLNASISIPEALIQKVKAPQLRAMLHGVPLGEATYSSPGEYTFTADIPAAALGDEAVTIDFALDRFLQAGVADSRELGLIVSSIGLEPK